MTPPRERLLKSALLCLALLSLAGTALYLVNQPEAPLKVAVQFTGSTNSPVTYTTDEGTFPNTLALFRITNLGNRSLLQWPRATYDTKYSYSESGADWGAPEFQSVLAPGQAKTVAVVGPWVEGPWRVGFRFSRVDWRWTVAKWPPWAKTILRIVLTERRLRLPYGQKVFSEWVDIPRIALAPARNESPRADSSGLTNGSPFLPAPPLGLTPTYPPKQVQ